MLWTPPPQSQFEYDDTTVGSANFATIMQGVAVTAGGSTNNKGAWAPIVSATARDWYGFWMSFTSALAPSGVNAAQLCDIGVGPSGSERVVFADFVTGHASVQSSVAAIGARSPVWVPLFIPKGSRVAVRTQSETASRVVRCHMIGESGVDVPRPIFTGCDTYGVTSSGASRGTNLQSNVTADVFGTWTNVGAATSRDYRGLMVSHQAQNINALNARNFVIEAGFGGAALVRVLANTDTVENWNIALNAQAVVRKVAAGTQLQARIACALGGQSQTPSVAFHCFY